MKYSVKQYASALLAALQGKTGQERGRVIANFFKILQKNADFGKRKSVVQEMRREYFRQNGIATAKVETADGAPEHIKKELETALGREVVLEERIDPGILGGIKILIDDETLMDASLKTMIDKAFRPTNNT